MSRAAATVVSAVLLAACAGGEAASYKTFQQRGGSGAVFRPSGSAPLVVLNLPADGASAEAVAASARPPARIGDAVMRAVPPGDPATAGARVVLSFAPANLEALCRATGPVGPAAAGPGTDATAAVCSDETFLGGARMQTAAAGPTAPGFGRALTALYGAAFSPGRGGGAGGADRGGGAGGGGGAR